MAKSSKHATMEMTLPSRGILYNGLLPEGKLKYRPMTGKEEKIILSGGKNHESFDQVVKNCSLNLPEELQPKDLLSTDRFFILIMLRALSYGPEYSFEVQCTDCSTKFRKTVNLEDEETFPVTVLEDTVVEPFEVTLPVSKDVVKFRLFRGKDEQLMARYVEKKYKEGEKGDPGYIYSVAAKLVEVNGESLNVVTAIPYVEDLIGRDSVYLRQAIDEADCGLDVTLKLTCPNGRCGADFEQGLPLTAEFFRPKY